ncbi:MAG: cytochrome c3 family protein, partial [Bacteroidetes bacterium]|nr:cytochrome c3 family protein [Bacteroidota bacterium]
IHKPVTNECDKCHQSNGKEHPKEDVEGFKLIKEVPQLCYSCHEQSTIEKEHIHAPIKEGDCLSCHTVHSSNAEHLLTVAPPGLCYSCHNDLQKTIETAAVEHRAVKEGKFCLNCHSPHSSSEKKMLVKAQPDVCFSCHDKKITVGDRILPNMKQLIEKSKFVHGAIENNGCSACHNPHASENKFLLAKTFPSGNYSSGQKENYMLCLDCHESSLFEDAQTTESTGFRNGNKNLHFVHVNKEKGRTCLNCHNVHASNNLFLLADKVKFGEWDMPINFNKLPKGGSCAPGCHSEKKYER